MHTPVQDRLIAATGATIVVAAFGYMLLLGLSVEMRARVEQVMTVLTLQAPPVPPPLSRPPPPKRKAAQGAGAPRNLRGRASEVVAPRPVVVLPTVSPVIAAVKPDIGVATQTGKADVAGPGAGAGGTSGGNGSGGYGDGGGDDDIPPRQIRGKLSYADLPTALRRSGASGDVDVRFYVLTDGRVAGCAVTRSSGNPDLDEATCRLLQQRFRFEPSRTPDGVAVRSIVEERHSWDRDRGYRQSD